MKLRVFKNYKAFIEIFLNYKQVAFSINKTVMY